jgi:ribosomal protein L11 methyltransferase
LGAKDVVGYDIDEWSVENTKHNAMINHVSNIEVFHGDSRVLSHVSGVFDIVMANINRNILLADIRHFKEVMAPNATLILSGFYVEDIPVMLEEAKKHGMDCVNQLTENNWACLILS